MNDLFHFVKNQFMDNETLSLHPPASETKDGEKPAGAFPQLPAHRPIGAASLGARRGQCPRGCLSVCQGAVRRCIPSDSVSPLGAMYCKERTGQETRVNERRGGTCALVINSWGPLRLPTQSTVNRATDSI